MARSLRLLLAATALTLVLPAAAGASSRQFSIFQDDATFLGHNGRDADAAMAEAKALGVDVIRVFLSWHTVSPNQDSRTPPVGFDPGDPSSPGYDWGLYDALVERVRRHGLKLMLTLSPPMPFWTSEEPSRCPHRIGGYSNLTLSCMWKPPPALFAQFTQAVALRYGSQASGPYGGEVAYYSLWNEPNLEHYLYPQLKRTRYGIVDLAARRYRELWQAGYREIAAHDPAARNRVLFGDVAAISSPMDTLYAALCLDEEGEPFVGKMRALQGCTRPTRLPIGGIAVHPYNKDAVGSVQTRSFTKDSLPAAYLPRLHRLMNNAARRGRIPAGRGVFITEFGFQSSPPDLRGQSLSLEQQAVAINEADRLFFGDSRIRSVAQYELFDVPNREEFNTGLRLIDGTAKPSWQAYRMPIVVTKVSRDLVEVWGQVRPAAGSTRVRIDTVSGSFAPAGLGTAVSQPTTNSSGYFRVRIRRSGAARLAYRTHWTSPTGEVMESRVARARSPLTYLEGIKPPKE